MRKTYKRFIVFAGNTYYAKGGLEDVLFTSDSIQGTINWIHDFIEDNNEFIWYNILDTSCNEEITLNDLKIYNKSVSQYE